MKKSKTEKTDITEKKMFRLSDDDLMHVIGGIGGLVTSSTENVDESSDDSEDDFGFYTFRPEFDYEYYIVD